MIVMTSKYLEEFEKLNTTTESIYELGDLEVLIILKIGMRVFSMSMNLFLNLMMKSFMSVKTSPNILI